MLNIMLEKKLYKIAFFILDSQFDFLVSTNCQKKTFATIVLDLDKNIFVVYIAFFYIKKIDAFSLVSLNYLINLLNI